MRRLHTSILILFLMVIVASLVYANTISKPHTLRDSFMIGNTVGDSFVRLYYTYSPPILSQNMTS